MKLMWFGMIVIVIFSESAIATCRDAQKWPFLSTSIWNTPIGSEAIFHDPGIFRPPFSLPWWGNPTPNKTQCNITGELYENISFPINATVIELGNNAAAILQPDNHTIINTQPLYRCTSGSPILSQVMTGLIAKDDIVWGNGTWGAHGGSGLSSIGGTIRLGELLPDTPPIQHALKLQLYASIYYYKKPPGFVWPALNCDEYAFHPNYPPHYNGSDIYLSPGALLAIPSNIHVNVTTIPGKKLLFALQNYGGYLCDDTFVNRGTLNTEHGVTEEFEATYGYPFGARPPGPGAEWYADMLILFQSLHVVINNNNKTIGGGGTPLQPLAPPICSI